jgi:signal transduction histidine kinase
LRSQVPKGEEYLFQIKDNGMYSSIPVQNIWYFSKLQNDDNSSGIGLSIVKRIIEFYGSLAWKPRKGMGTTFFFTIPKDHGTA